MQCVRFTIPRISNKYKLYVFRSRSAEDINTIAKVKELNPILMIDESIAEGKYYQAIDNTDNNTNGIEYYGPVPNTIPTVEYESNISIEKINNYTYLNVLTLNPLPLKFNGVMLYYSVIGVDDKTNLITHLSKVSSVMVKNNYEQDGVRHIYCSNNSESNDWTFVSSVAWDENIEIGNHNNKYDFDRFGIPVIETVHSLDKKEINIITKGVAQRNFMVLEIQNPWMRNNREFNYRKLKSFKIQNVVGNQYGNFSEPTYQSELPVSIEKMLILIKKDAEDPNKIITPDDTVGYNTKVYEVIRKDGIYYEPKKHKRLGFNKYNIPLGETVAVFSEASVQDKIKMQIAATPLHTYSISIYLVDVYNKYSEPVHIVVKT